MNNQETEQFLDIYRQLETAAEKLVGTDSRGSSILRLSHLPEFEPYREELDYCRQVRNLLTHEAKVEGEYGIYPSKPLQAVLSKVLRLVEDPPTVADFMTPVKQLLTARLQDPVLPLLEKMDKQGISYVPLLQSGVVTGVFGLKPFVRRLLTSKQPLDETTTLTDFAAFLPVEQHKGVTFVSPYLTLEKGRELFQKIYVKNERIKLLLVTKGGRNDRPLLGIVSPYDLLKED